MPKEKAAELELPECSDEFAFELLHLVGLSISAFDGFLRGGALLWSREDGRDEAITELMDMRERARTAHAAGNVEAMMGWGKAMLWYADYVTYRYSAHPKATFAAKSLARHRTNGRDANSRRQEAADAQALRSYRDWESRTQLVLPPGADERVSKYLATHTLKDRQRRRIRKLLSEGKLSVS